MMGILPIISLLVVVILSLMVVRIATIALALTGLSDQLARFRDPHLRELDLQRKNLKK